MKNQKAKFLEGVPELLHIVNTSAEILAKVLIALMFGWSLGTVIEIFVRELSK